MKHERPRGKSARQFPFRSFDEQERKERREGRKEGKTHIRQSNVLIPQPTLLDIRLVGVVVDPAEGVEVALFVERAVG